MRLSYSPQALAGRRGSPTPSTPLQQPRQVPSRAHAQSLCDPRQRHRRLRAQRPGQLNLPWLPFAPRLHVGLAPTHPLQPRHHQPLGLHRLRLLHHLPEMARPRPRLHLLQQLLPKLLPAQTPPPLHPLELTPQILPSPPLHPLPKRPPPRRTVLGDAPLPQQPVHPQPARTPRRRRQILRIAALGKIAQALPRLEQLRPRRIQMHIITHRLEIPVAAPLHNQRLVAPAEQVPEFFVPP